MNQHIINAGLFSLAMGGLFTAAEYLYHKLKVRAELTRKFVHVGAGLLCILLPLIITDPLLILVLAGSFLLVLLLSMKLQFLPSVNAINRDSQGSIVYPMVILICFLLYYHSHQYVYYYIPILIMALCDPLAALVGQKWPIGPYTFFGESRTLIGSCAFFIGAIGMSLLLFCLFEGLPLTRHIGNAIVLALVATLTEAFTIKGYDNLAIPLALVFTLMLLNQLA